MQARTLSLQQAASHLDGIVKSAQVDCAHPDPIRELAGGLGDGPFSLIVILASIAPEFQQWMNDAAKIFGNAQTIGCTTAGEISRDGYAEGTIVAIGFPASHFSVEPLLIPDLDNFDQQDLISQMIRSRTSLTASASQWPHEFAFLAIDGLSVREDEVAATIANGLGPVPLFGGSAGDNNEFQETLVALNGETHQHAAVLCFVRTVCPVKVFSLDHLMPSEVRMVVTSADPERRIVHEINAEPAAKEYARLLGKEFEDLSSFTFAAHPVVVRLGASHHVRSIQQVLENGDLVFFSAIDEGLVLTLARPEDMAHHLERELQRVTGGRKAEAIFGCDCMLRRVEAQQRQILGDLSSILSRHRVVGFSTYGEQINGLHVNQTMTGVAIFAPDGE